MARATPFSVGQRWYVDCKAEGRPSFWFVILGPPHYDHNNPKRYKRCRIEVDLRDYDGASEGNKEYVRKRGYHGTEGDYSHTHLKKHAVWEGPPK